VTRAVRHPLLLALAAASTAIGLTVPFSPAGAFPQWDDLVLAVVGLAAAWRCGRLTRQMRRRDRLPWQLLGVSALLFGAASLVTGLGLGGHLGSLSFGDALVFVAALGPAVSSALIGGRVRGTRWPVLVVDGLMVTFALVVVADVLVLSPALAPGAISRDLQPLVLAYGIYPAVAVGVVGALCTVSAAAVRRPATAMILMTGLLAVSSALLAAHIVQPGGPWAGAADLAIVGALVTGVRAVGLAHSAPSRGSAEDVAPAVNAAGVAVDVVALGGVPVTLVAALVLDLPIHDGAIACTAVVILLLLVRLVLRIRDTGRMQEDLVRSQEDFRGLVEASSDGVAIVDTDLRLEFTSPAARTLLGIAPGRDPHPVLLDLLHEEDRNRIRLELTAVGGEVAPAFHLRVQTPGGEPRDLEVIHHERPGSGRRVLHLRDVTTRRRRERELERMAFTDHLTRLPNRAALFQEMATLTTASGDRSLLVLDLDGFKAVNDSAGHEAGDLLLVEVARRLQGLVRTDDLVARLGGDEFAVLMAGPEEAAVEAGQRVVEVLAQPYRVGSRTFTVGASVGLCRVHPGGGQLAFRQADTALGAAKQAGKGCWRVHTDDRVAQAAATSSVAAALSDGDVQLRFDTIANGDTGILAALHAEPVWVHPELGVLPAAELWAAAERQGSTAALQQWLLTQACADIAALDPQLLVAVDLPAGLVHADELPGEVAAALAAAGMAPPRLTLFFTEEVLQTSSAALIPALHTVHEAGVRLGLDDYGMGATLWSQLARLPLEVVVVDVRNLSVGDNQDRTLELLGAIGRSARSFDVSTVAKEISSRELLNDLRAQGLVAVSGPVLPSGLTAAQVAALLRHPSSAVVAPIPVPRPRVEAHCCGTPPPRSSRRSPCHARASKRGDPGSRDRRYWGGERTGPAVPRPLHRARTTGRAHGADRPAADPPARTAAPRRRPAGPLRLVRGRPGADLAPAQRPPAPALAAPAGPQHADRRAPRRRALAHPARLHRRPGARRRGEPHRRRADRDRHARRPRGTPLGPAADARTARARGRSPAPRGRRHRLRRRRHRPVPGHGRPGRRRGGRRAAPGVGLGPLARPRAPGPRRRRRGRAAAPPAGRRAGALGHLRHGRPRQPAQPPPRPDACAAGRAAAPVRRRRRRRDLGRGPGHPGAGHPARLARRAAVPAPPDAGPLPHRTARPRGHAVSGTAALASSWTDGSSLGYPVVFGGVLLGSVVPVVPTGAVVGAAAAVALTTGELSLPLVVLLSTLGAFVGDVITFTICRFGGPTAVRWVARGARRPAVDPRRLRRRRHHLHHLPLRRPHRGPLGRARSARRPDRGGARAVPAARLADRRRRPAAPRRPDPGAARRRRARLPLAAAAARVLRRRAGVGGRLLTARRGQRRHLRLPAHRHTDRHAAGAARRPGAEPGLPPPRRTRYPAVLALRAGSEPGGSALGAGSGPGRRTAEPRGV